MEAKIGRAMMLGLIIVGMSLVSSCSSRGDAFCDGVKSVSGFVSQFSQGLDNFAEDRYAQLRLDALDVLDTARASMKDKAHGQDASKLALRLQTFVTALDDVSWDVSVALDNTKAVEAAAALGTQESLSAANSVESVVINRCGLPTTLPALIGSDSLPFPSIPEPTATEPPDNGPNENSEFLATGQMVATQFQLTLSQTEVLCLGRELQNVYDSDSSSVDPSHGRSVYQTAFDTCGINFVVPSE